MRGSNAISYEEAKRQARGGSEDRRLLAANPSTRPEILYFLAEDESVEVRREIAKNDGTPWQAADLLGADGDNDVRLFLADKLARLLPTLREDEREHVYQHAAEAIAKLARDQASRVREIVAGALKDIVDAPPDIVSVLARDEELSVAGPILECSPVLTDDDLLDIIASTSTIGAHGAIARRREVSANVSDAIVEHGDTSAIADLLANKSTQIREETLDRIIAQAEKNPSWHPPLVRRPKLPTSAVLRIAGFVADKLLAELNERLDLDEHTKTALADFVRRRIQDDANGSDVSARQVADPDWAETTEDPKQRAERLQRAGKLDEEVIAEALLAGDRRFATAALTLATGLTNDEVTRLLAAHNPKGVVALVWKAGFSMDLAVRLQMQLAGIPPAKTLRARKDGDYPLSPTEMKFQLEFVTG